MVGGSELRITAFHEAGHCVGAVIMGLRFLSLGVTIAWGDDQEDSGNTFAVRPRGGTESDILKDLTYLLCGGVAERILAADDKHRVPGADADINEAEKVLSSVVDEIRNAELRRRSYEQANTLLRENWAAVEAIASELIKHRSLRPDRIKAIVNQHGPKRRAATRTKARGKRRTC